jgi:hypothetical protein
MISDTPTIDRPFIHQLIDQRLTELNAELESGRRLQIELETRQEELRRSMLRIGGAIQVLGELRQSVDAVSTGHNDAMAATSAEVPVPFRRTAER